MQKTCQIYEYVFKILFFPKCVYSTCLFKNGRKLLCLLYIFWIIVNGRIFIPTILLYFFNSKVTTEGRGRFPGQEKYNVAVGGYDSEITLLNIIGADADQNSQSTFNSFDHGEGSNWRSIFGVDAEGAALAEGSTVINDTGTEGHTEFMAEFANNAIKSPFQDGHYIYIVLPGGIQYVDPDGDGTYVKVPCLDCSPILYVADNENPSKIFKKYQP